MAKLTPEEQRWSRRHNGQGELLDQILAGAGLMPIQGSLRQVPTIDIRNADAPNMLGEHPREVAVAPDHAPVTATFQI